MTPAAGDDKPSDGSLRILHVLRAPLGGLFRHVVDLARAQSERGHLVGVVADSTTGGARADAVFAELSPSLALGVTRRPMRRNPHVSDIGAIAHVMTRARAVRADVVHGHGSKGGLYARAPGFVSGAGQPLRAYTPHGGSFNFPSGVMSDLYMRTERLLERATDVLLFESAYIAQRFEARAGGSHALRRFVLNGIAPAEAQPVAPRPDAADFVYVGELRAAKGIDTLIDALADLARDGGPRPSAVLVGSGPDDAVLRERARSRGLDDRVSFAGVLSAREAFSRGRTLVVPSRAESLPYIVIEAAGARMPIIATNVGGIPEIFGPFRDRLLPCDDIARLCQAMQAALLEPEAERYVKAETLGAHVIKYFTISAMVDATVAGYRDGLRAREAGFEAALA